MKITRSQKEAVISLLKEKFDEKNKAVRKAYIEEHKAELETKVNHYLELQEEAKVLANRLREIYHETKSPNKLKDGDINVYGVHTTYNFYQNPSKESLVDNVSSKYLFDHIFVSKVEEPDYDIVNRELELASLGKDFDLNGFLAKYLPE